MSFSSEVLSVIKLEWFQDGLCGPYAEKKEVIGTMPALFNWHCKMPMLRIFLFVRKEDGIKHAGLVARVCRVCGTRQHEPY